MKKIIIISLFGFLLVSCSLLPGRDGLEPGHLKLPELGIAPELTNEVWINTDHALRLADLRGEVVLIEMWTFG